MIKIALMTHDKSNGYRAVMLNSTNQTMIFGRDWVNISKANNAYVYAFNSAKEVYDFIKSGWSITKNKKGNHTIFELVGFYTLPANGFHVPITVDDNVRDWNDFHKDFLWMSGNIVVPSKNSPVGSRATIERTKPKIDYAPGEALKAFRRGEEVDWEALSEHRYGSGKYN